MCSREIYLLDGPRGRRGLSRREAHLRGVYQDGAQGQDGAVRHPPAAGGTEWRLHVPHGTGLSRAELGWTRLDWTELVGLSWTGLEDPGWLTGLGGTRRDWTGWAGLGETGLGCAGLFNCIELRLSFLHELLNVHPPVVRTASACVLSGGVLTPSVCYFSTSLTPA